MFADMHFSIATRKHAEEIEEFLHAEFGTREPMTICLNPSRADLSDNFRDLAHAGCSNEKYSTLVHQRDRGRVTSKCLALQEFPEIAKGPYKQHKANQLTAFVDAMEQALRRLPDAFTKYLKIDILCVAGDAKGRGLGKELVQRAVKIARAEGCEWVTAVATAAASQAIFSQLGFKTIYQIPFANFRENGVVVFNNLSDGCISGKLVALRLND
ncbi:unnamed protein product [Angiostrongylus costaricensis]|uniref:N-acetyltransferase domain-containing protein n=1 Tax=Angiostrongylus costaricensis TaxID=334426 RepID=A0A0R3PLZ5_ANGCS|nr:unnamed protein product [Angiostrongylus costaricensis]